MTNIDRLFGALTEIPSTSVTLKVVREQKPIEVTVDRPSIVVTETASAAKVFQKLPVRPSSKRTVTANQPTNNDPLHTLTDGILGKGYGPIFGNGIRNGAYKMDLGRVQPVNAITSWSYDEGQVRGAQCLSIYGSNSSSDPGWDFKAMTLLGTIDTLGWKRAEFTAASIRTPSGKPLGNFRWIVWSVLPVSPTAGGENTAFQELAVEIDGEETKVNSTRANSLQAFPGDKTDFRGYERYDKIPTDKGHFSVVCPQHPAPGKPWLWRSLFWEGVKKFSDADLKLVDEGYHVVLAHGDVAGHPSGNANIDAAYEMLTTKYGFSKKCSMGSMSRGTLSLFRWASANPEKVDSIYVDNGVCNVLSWPAGKLVPGSGSKASGDPESWEGFKRKFGYATDEEALKTKESPIDQLEPLAKIGVPILMVCGSRDAVVPYEENDAILEQRYKALGGSITVIVEDKGHTHGMDDPAPVLNFIRQHTSAGKETR